MLVPYEAVRHWRETRLIILDANILERMDGRGADEELLRTLHMVKAEKVGAPETVIEEVLSHRVLAYDRAFTASVEAAEKLNATTPWADVPAPTGYDPERLREHWRNKYSRIAAPMEISAAVYREAIRREANEIKPCKRAGKEKVGARDATIWLSAVEYARKNPKERVYFISNNPADFGDGKDWPEQLARDIEDMKDRFFLFTSLSGVLNQFATKVPTTVEEVRDLLATAERISGLTRRARMTYLHQRINSHRFRPIPDPPHSLGSTSEASRGIRVALADVSNPRAYKIGTHTWHTATARWVVASPLPFLEGKYHLQSWTTRAMVSASAGPGNISVLENHPYEPARAGDGAHFPDLDGALIGDPEGLAGIHLQEAVELLTLLAANAGRRVLEEEGVVRPFHGDTPDVGEGI
ncbi:PIN domain-containing protein [Kitasatospora phosalacinea]|uniref:PIN domain-containing protein n=1 Tax=Kitasatospora phosalacinea TaxID=2065 RepID=UPI0035D685CF